MSIFDNLYERITEATSEAEEAYQEYGFFEDLYWKAQKTGQGIEYASIREGWVLKKAGQASDKLAALESIEILEPAKNADIDSLKASLNEILKEAEGNELSVFITTRLDEWAKSIDPAFSFSEWGDAKTGTQGFFPIFHIHFPRGKWTHEMMRNINILGRALRRDIDYMVDIYTTKEGAKKKQSRQTLTLSGEGMHLAAVNWSGRLRHKRPRPLGPFTHAISNVSYHAGDSSYKK